MNCTHKTDNTVAIVLPIITSDEIAELHLTGQDMPQAQIDVYCCQAWAFLQLQKKHDYQLQISDNGKCAVATHKQTEKRWLILTRPYSTEDSISIVKEESLN